MLNFSEIAQRIEDASSIRQEDLSDLKQLAEHYPFAPLFSQLYLKGLSVYNPLQFDVDLVNYAYRIPDRACLYFMVNDTITIKERKSKEISTEKTIEHSPVDENQEKAPSSIDTTSEVKEEEIKSSEDTPSIKATESNQIQETEEKKEKRFDDLERDILAHAVSSSIYLEVDEEIQEDEYVFDRLREIDNETEKKNEDEKLPTFHLNIASEETSEETGNDENLRTFISWMNVEEKVQRNSYVIEKSSEENKNLKKNKENFSEERPQIEFFSPIKKAKESLDESRLPVSETLAKIYALQGNYPKAITAYQKLMLNFPKKKTYFALQIEILKKKL